MIRSLIFNAAMYVWMGILGLAGLPLMALSANGARRVMDFYTHSTLVLLGVLTGLRCEIRGTPPREGALVAAKHQSFMDVIVLWNAVPRGFFIMKSILQYAPVLGQYALRSGCIPVARGKRGEAIRQMLAEIRSGKRADGQLLIYPQGTRVAPGAQAPYKVGTFAMYEQLGQPCYPVATNIGLYWPKRGVLRRPGRAVMEFLDPIPPGLDRTRFMTELETRIETASNRLMAEAGFPVAEVPPLTGDPVAAAARDVVQNR
ncbi:lysophospholipid acyltransferase family protein [Jannaschia formosa]|uniref:lysophospholipid acyltransferase family protein n=1 Tax=Jannaschia formosa TaxID=2259592 RepID=UPI0027953239|nr:lysophospholipid acyltransferase family protein [Jannaschia formosa]